MPIYEFQCAKDHKFELMQSLTKRTATAKCPTCGGRSKKQLSVFAIAGGADSDTSDFGDMGDMGGLGDMGGMGGMPGMDDLDMGDDDFDF